jgi:cysteine desulfurase
MFMEPVKERVYLDWNATAPLRPEARAAMVAALDLVGNPSSVHADGRAARQVIEDAREKVAVLVGAEARNVVFTSGGTEANVLALAPGLSGHGDKAPRDRLLVSAIEHASVRRGGRFPQGSIEELPVGPDGVLDLSILDRRLNALRSSGGRPLVSIMHANNETGIVQPVAAAAELVHAAGGRLHVDAVQSAGKISCDITALGADLISISAHKLGGPKGVGALVMHTTDIQISDPLLVGGGQERGRRAGTENVAAIAGFGAAAAAGALASEQARVAALRDRLESALRAASPGLVIFGAGVERLPNTTLFAVAGAKAETLLIALDLAGIAVSSGSACSSGKVAPSHVLAAMGVPAALARAAIRVSLGHTTAECDIELFQKAWTTVSAGLSKASAPGGSSGLAA